MTFCIWFFKSSKPLEALV
ncbi:hypothetical protein HU200_056272 [Digitaria exilis]|uniref:Uncharacterized protein n=1 Tax=Digitaria exilis TaxID=1010633 RepID=A0A835E2V1_9POAL|nr:hypothetical protein HU200_056272 [Digitaria exilis]